MDTRFSSAIHTLILIAGAEKPLTSDRIAKSVGTNASYIRRITGLLKKQGIIGSRQGAGGFTLLVKPRDLTLYRIYQAIAGTEQVVTDVDALAQLQLWLFNATELPGAGCPFSGVLTLTRADGSEFSLCPAEDSCGVAFADGKYYRYAADNDAFRRMFGIAGG